MLRNVSSQHGPVGSPSITGQTRRNSQTGRSAASAAAKARIPSLTRPWKRTVGSLKACPSPPSQDSNVSTPAVLRARTMGSIPASSGGENSSSSISGWAFMASPQAKVVPWGMGATRFSPSYNPHTEPAPTPERGDNAGLVSECKRNLPKQPRLPPRPFSGSIRTMTRANAEG